MAVILHVDMDAFFASVEVGSGPHERGVVSTCSYEARKFGIRSAMPSRTAYQLCPHAIFTYPNMEAYQEVSDKAFEVFSHYTPYVEGVSVDEAFLDITGSLHLYGEKHAGARARAKALGEALRAEIRRVRSASRQTAFSRRSVPSRTSRTALRSCRSSKTRSRRSCATSR